MKKLLFRTFMLSLALIASINLNMVKAEIPADFTSSEQALRQQHYSEETIRLIQLQKVDWTSEPIRKQKDPILVRFYRYLDPASDDKNFGTTNLNWDNNWEDL